MQLRQLNVFAQRLAGSLAALAIIAYLDFKTGYELSSSPVYLLPVALTFFHFGRVGGYIAAVVAAVTWTLVNKWSGAPFSKEILRWETGFMRFVVYALAVWGLSLYRKTVATHRERVETMRQLIPVCHECGRIAVATGEWMTPEEMLNATPSAPRICPTCASRADVTQS